MIDPLREKELMRSYLLGQLPALEQAEIEERYFSNDESFDLLEETRMALIDDYVRGKLSVSEARTVEERAAQDKDWASAVAVARGLAKDRVRAKRIKWPVWAAVAAGLALAGYGLVGLLQTKPAVPEIAQLVPTISLTNPVTRAAASQSVTNIPASVQSVRVELAIAEAVDQVDVTIERGGAGRVFRIEGLRRSDGSVTALVPASLLSPGDYEFVVTQSDGAKQTLATFATKISRQ